MDRAKVSNAPWIASVMALAFAASGPTIATAKVLEIDETGAVTVHDRPEVTTTDGATAINAQPAPDSRSEPRPTRKTEITDAANGAALSPDLVEAVAWRESGLRSGLVSSAGAIGEMQLMPDTARSLKVDPHDTRQNFQGGATYLSQLLKRYDGDVVRALAAYNAGPKVVDRYGGVPPYKETQAYVAAILERLSRRAVAPQERPSDAKP